MAERSIPWTGTVTGDAGPYSFDDWAEVWRTLMQATSGQGVFADLLNELAVSGVTSPVTVATGYALDHGTWYENSAAVTVVIPTPSASTRVDRIVLRKSWSAQTVRITRVAGVEGSGAPSLVQSDGVTWDIPLANASITTGGVITVSDTREFIRAGAILQAVTGTSTSKVTATNQDVETFVFEAVITPTRIGNTVHVQAVVNGCNPGGTGRLFLKLRWQDNVSAGVTGTQIGGGQVNLLGALNVSVPMIGSFVTTSLNPHYVKVTATKLDSSTTWETIDQGADDRSGIFLTEEQT